MLEALRLGLKLEPVLATSGFLASAPGEEVLARLPRPPLVAASRLLDGLADADSPRGLLAVCALPRTGLAGLAPGKPGVWLYLDRIQDPGNLGALARVAEGLGAAGLLLSPGCADPNHARALRASAGSLLRLPLAIQVEPAAAREHFAEIPQRLASQPARSPAPRSAGVRWIGLEAHHGSIRLADLDPAGHGETVIVALGGEGPGLSAATRAQQDTAVTIPLAGRLESLNVAVAAALVLARLAPMAPVDPMAPLPLPITPP